jgi:hypothetical protein
MTAWEVSYTPDPAKVEFFPLLKWKTSFKGRLQDCGHQEEGNHPIKCIPF